MCTCSVEKDNGRTFSPPFLHCNPLTVGTTHITAISCCYYTDTESFIFWGLPDHFPQWAHWMPLSLTVFSSLSTAEPRVSLGSCFSLWFGSTGWLSERNWLIPPLLFPAPHMPACNVRAGVISGGSLALWESQTALDGPDTSCSNK